MGNRQLDVRGFQFFSLPRAGLVRAARVRRAASTRRNRTRHAGRHIFGTPRRTRSQLEQAQSAAKEKTGDHAAGSGGENAAGTPLLRFRANQSAISSYHSLTVLQKRMSGLDSRIRNQQDLAGSLRAVGRAGRNARERSRCTVFCFRGLDAGDRRGRADRGLISCERMFDRLEPDQQKPAHAARRRAHRYAHRGR